jgi:hypothetical protein
MENCGVFTATLLKKTREEIIVGVRTIDGSAKARDDFTPINEVIRVAYLEHKIEVKIKFDE